MSRLKIARSLLPLVVGFVACGSSARELQKAPAEATYRADFATVWNAVDAVMRERFRADGLLIEDGASGVIFSKWKAMATSYAARRTAGSLGVGNRPGSALQTAEMLQLRVKIEPAGSAWRVLVDAEAGHLEGGQKVLTPYPRHSEDEPEWVDGQIEDVRSAIHDRLRDHVGR